METMILFVDHYGMCSLNYLFVFPSHMFLPSYTALKPCALTAKSVVNHKASMDPLLTIGEGSMNPDNLQTNIQNEMLLQKD